MQPISGATRIYDFDVRSVQWNLILVWESPCGGWEPKRETQICNPEPVEWDRACQWINGIMTGIGKQWERSKYQDIYCEPATCPRPWTPELFAAFLRELRRDTEASTVARRIKELDAAIVWPRTVESTKYVLGKQSEINLELDRMDKEVRACSA